MSLSASVVNSWTSNPVCGVIFEMRLIPLRAVCVAGSGGAVTFLVSYGAASVTSVPAGGEVLTPPTLRAGGDKYGLSW